MSLILLSLVRRCGHGRLCAMSDSLLLADAATRDDLRTFVQRLQRAGEPELRLVTKGRTLAVFGCTQAPQGLLDAVPVVLVSRGFALAEAPMKPIDVTVEGRALLDRFARMEAEQTPVPVLELPDAHAFAAWAGVLPPVSGWQRRGAVDAASLRAVAAEGIARVAVALPEQPGEAVVRRVRAEVWGAEIAPGIPAAAAFAAETMGFLGDAAAELSASISWVRLTTARGHVLVRGLLG